MAEVDPSTLHGFNPNSPYAKLFLDIFQLTKPNDDFAQPVKRDINWNMKNCEAVSDEDEIEEGEINDNDEAIIPPTLDTIDKLLMKPTHPINNNKVKVVKLKPRKPFKKETQQKASPPAPPQRLSIGPTPAVIMGSKRSPVRLDLKSQIDLDSDPVRLGWLQNLMLFMESRGTPIKSSPVRPTAVSISPDLQTNKREALDLYSLYHITLEQAGGMNPCTDTKGWKAVAARMNVPVQKAFLLRAIYQEYLLPYEEFQSTSRERKVLLPTPSFEFKGQGTSFINQTQSSSIHVGQATFSLGQGQGQVTSFQHQGGKGLAKHMEIIKGSIKKRLGFKTKKEGFCQNWNQNKTHPPCTNQQTEGGCITNGKFLKHSCSKRLPGKGLVRCCSIKHGFHGH